jgi:hypothetical protein
MVGIPVPDVPGRGRYARTAAGPARAVPGGKPASLSSHCPVAFARIARELFIRANRDGPELPRTDLPGRRAIARVLGGPERRTFFCLNAATSHEEFRQRKSSARIDVVDVEIPGAGYP